MNDLLKNFNQVEEISDQEVFDAIMSVPKHYSASHVVDIGNGCGYDPSVVCAATISPASGTIVGQIVDLLNDNAFTNLYVAGGPTSGPLAVLVQTSDATTSGSFTDPTSGLPQFPTAFSSGGLFWVNSGLYSSGIDPWSSIVNNAPLFCSGGVQFAAFQRVGRYVRAIALSGAFDQPMTAGFISQRKTTGSGGGFTYSPSSGSVNV